MRKSLTASTPLHVDFASTNIVTIKKLSICVQYNYQFAFILAFLAVRIHCFLPPTV